jgi:hypothetical protein
LPTSSCVEFLQSKKQQVEAVAAELQRRIGLFPNFEYEVALNPTRRLVLRELHELSEDILEKSRVAQLQANVGSSMDAVMEGIYSWRRMVRPKVYKQVETGGWIRLTASGEVSVPRHEFPSLNEVWFDRTQFSFCAKNIRERVSTDRIDVSLAPDKTLTTYLVAAYEANKAKPVFKSPFGREWTED